MTPTPPTRATLLLRLRDPEDASAWEEFVEIYQPLIYRLARARGLQAADAADVVQDAMARIATAINRFQTDAGGSFRGWISRITRNLVIDFLRNQQRLPVLTDPNTVTSLFAAEDRGSAEAEMFDREHERGLFHWAAQQVQPRFSESTWQAFWRTAVESQPVDQVAAELDLTRGAVYIARSRVMAQLKSRIRATQFESGLHSTGAPS